MAIGRRSKASLLIRGFRRNGFSALLLVMPLSKNLSLCRTWETTFRGAAKGKVLPNGGGQKELNS